MAHSGVVQRQDATIGLRARRGEEEEPRAAGANDEAGDNTESVMQHYAKTLEQEAKIFQAVGTANKKLRAQVSQGHVMMEVIKSGNQECKTNMSVTASPLFLFPCELITKF